MYADIDEIDILKVMLLADSVFVFVADAEFCITMPLQFIYASTRGIASGESRGYHQWRS